LLFELTQRQEQLAADEEKFWQEQLVTLLQAANAQDEELLLQQQSAAANAHLAVLRRSHALNDCFLIMPGEGNSPFATINGFRIGRARALQPHLSHASYAFRLRHRASSHVQCRLAGG
jgi:hypothetical protein